MSPRPQRSAELLDPHAWGWVVWVPSHQRMRRDPVWPLATRLPRRRNRRCIGSWTRTIWYPPRPGRWAPRRTR